MIAMDSKGTLYTSETIDGRRLQKFVPQGFVPEERLKALCGQPALRRAAVKERRAFGRVSALRECRLNPLERARTEPKLASGLLV